MGLSDGGFIFSENGRRCVRGIGMKTEEKGTHQLCRGMPFHINPMREGYLAMPTRLRMKANSKAVSLMLS